MDSVIVRIMKVYIDIYIIYNIYNIYIYIYIGAEERAAYTATGGSDQTDNKFQARSAND